LSELILLRHGKSDWSVGGEDADRPLSRRGEESAQSMGRMLTLAGRVPDLVLSSPARRARSTADLAAEAGGWPSPIVEDERLCPGSPRQLFEVIRQSAGGAQRVLVVGHEPALSQTAAGLLGGASLRMVTAAAACIEVDGWEALGLDSGTLLWMVTPRLLSEGRFPSR
jgi:phosphohistidine phosphatase